MLTDALVDVTLAAEGEHQGTHSRTLSVHAQKTCLPQACHSLVASVPTPLASHNASWTQMACSEAQSRECVLHACLLLHEAQEEQRFPLRAYACTNVLQGMHTPNPIRTGSTQCTHCCANPEMYGVHLEEYTCHLAEAAFPCTQCTMSP
ncbi:hypothetical protein COU77_01355 [Candidatus Peregrinibacteria bacterium CG10_big_fil_rev_8_21_14_0_10_49_16]|nr:MAG: hypothetical protein COW95_01285 [Candidatus Peregrinibacteria bacterium CG22_combo_CG10-13_8_21_14_all_49_11]PIR52257.1 MAG: hypothetical protein COU77_01355 [Candidatus Peregrinibacteria bacterium CG10_big_fil_rev_8_21_14_0_10_49_16]